MTRRDLLRHAEDLNGLDHVELVADGCTLLLSFIKPPPEGVQPRNIVLEGDNPPGITEVTLRSGLDEQPDDLLAVALDRRGGHGAYRLRLRDVPGLDPYYACAPFRFRLEETTALDCVAPAPPEPPPPPAPEIDYLARDFASFRQLMLDRLALTLPAWQERHIPDIGIAVVEILAHTADHLAYWQDAVATEAYIGTARLRSSVRRHARLVDYPMHEGCNARAFIHLACEADTRLPAGRLQVATADGTAVFLPVGPEPLALHVAQNAMRLHDWGEPTGTLPQGATAATLVCDGALHLAPGDLLLLEAVDPADGSPAALALRHVVRLIEVEPDQDPLLALRLVRLRWAAADALPFALPFARDGATLAVARGNLLLADHGAWTKLTLRPGETLLDAPALDFSAPLPAPETAASAMLRPDPRQARAQLTIASTAPGGQQDWRLVPDLLRSDARDHDVVAEPEADGSMRLRFGATKPAPGSSFSIAARLGNGPAGNLGADRLTVALLGGQPAPGLHPRNPLPASGGIAPEALESVRLRAPRALHNVLLRAVTEDDYAAIAGQHPRVQRAAARMTWTGSRQLVRVALDPLGGQDADPALQAEVTALLAPCRRIGHVLEVVGASYVPLVVVLDVQLAPHVARGQVRAGLLARLGNGLLADGSRALFHPDNLSFGEAVHASRILAAAHGVSGVLAATLLRLERQYEGPNGEVAAGVLPVGRFEIARLAPQPGRPGRGHLTLRLRGGR